MPLADDNVVAKARNPRQQSFVFQYL